MNKMQKILLGVLAAQLLLVALVFWPKSESAENRDLVFGERTAEEVNRIDVVDSDGNEVVLLKDGENWILSEPQSYPAEKTKVNTMLDDLLAVRYGRFVAENASSHDRLEVGDKKFNRKITLTFADGTSGTIYVGSTPNTASTNFRMEGDDNVYLSDQLNSYSYGSTKASWINTALVRVTADTVNGMQLSNANGTYEFSKAEGNIWTITGLAEGEEANAQAISSLLNRATGLTITEPLGSNRESSYGLSTPTATMVLSVTDSEGNPQQITLVFGTVDVETGQVVVESSAWDYYVKVNASAIPEILESSAADFITVPEAETAPAS
jgi:hypothetical protein